MSLFWFLSVDYLFERSDNSPLIFFRVLFGLLITAEAWGAILTGWVRRAFVEVQFTFNFIGLEFLQPLPGDGMFYYFALMGCFGVMIMLGWYYRLATVVYFLMWGGVYFMQKTHYNNHYYLLWLLLGLMILIPANSYFSIDAKRNPALRDLTCPNWVLMTFKVQVAIVYFYAATSKVYDDWLAGAPIEIWFANKQHYWLVGEILQEPWLQMMVVYGGIFFDLLVVPALMWKRTRMAAFVFSIFFHGFNSVVFQVGIFPYMALGFCVFYFEPETIRRIFFKKKPQPGMADLALQKPKNLFPIYLWYGYMIIQLLLPIRYHLYPGNVHWTEEGHRLSWKMMLRAKSGSITFRVKNKDTGDTKVFKARDYLSYSQYKKVSTHPDFAWQFVQRMKEILADEGWTNVEIYAKSRVSLNGRPAQPLYDPEFDLATAEWSVFKHSEWVVPLDSR